MAADTDVKEPAAPGRAWLGLAALVAANLVIAAQALHWGWGYYQLLLIYWIEALVIGAYNVLRMVIVGFFGEQPLGAWLSRRARFSAGSRLVLTVLAIGFFVTKFGGIALATGFWIATLPAQLETAGTPADRVLGALGEAVPGAALAAGAVVASHGVSFAWNFVGRREFVTQSLVGLVFWPYLRMAMALVVVVGGLFYARLNPQVESAAMLIGLVIALKVVADAIAHVWEHRAAAVTRGVASGRGEPGTGPQGRRIAPAD